MMFSFPTSITSLRNAVITAKMHSLYMCISDRTKSNKTDLMRVVSYEDMQQVIQKPKKVVIDVREPYEIASTGKIPSSINIPLPCIDETLASMSQDDFRRQFNREKPTVQDELIFYCRAGNRSKQALDKALQLGYKNSKHYLGSWDEWSSKKK